jgi:hypothetical protein
VKAFFSNLDWRLFLIAPLAAAIIALVFAPERDIMVIKGIPEFMALVLTGAAVAVSGFRLKIENNPLMPLLFAFCLAFFSREIHFAGTSTGVYIVVVLIALWAWRWRERLVNPVNTGRFKSWLFAAGWAYLLALLVQRRFFKHVFPDFLLAWEGHIHVPMEEWMEVVAHALLLVTVFSGFSGSLRKRA